MNYLNNVNSSLIGNCPKTQKHKKAKRQKDKNTKRQKSEKASSSF